MQFHYTHGRPERQGETEANGDNSRMVIAFATLHEADARYIRFEAYQNAAVGRTKSAQSQLQDKQGGASRKRVNMNCRFAGVMGIIPR